MNEPSFGRPWWTRRGFLQGSAAAIAGVYGLPGRLGYAAEIPSQFDGSKFQLAAPEPNPKSGGVLALGHPNAPAAFRYSPSRDNRDARRDGRHVR